MSRRSRTGDDPLDRARARARAARRAVLRRAAHRQLRRQPRGRAPRCALASLLRYATGRRCRSTRTRSSTARSARRARVVEDLTAALTEGDRGAHPPGRRDQAPGQDGHRRHLALRRDAAPGAARAARCSPPARRATASPTARCARWSPSTPRSSRSRATPATASRAIRAATTTITSSTAAASRATSRRAPRPTRRCAARKHRVATEREVTVVRGRADGRTLIIVPEVKDNQTTGHHAAARAVPRPAAGRRGAPGARGLPRSLPGHRRPGDGDRAGHPRRRARARSTSSTC